MTEFSSIEICAGAGGTALGLEWAGFRPAALVEYIPVFCETLQTNRPDWKIFGPGADGDVTTFDGRPYHGGIDLLSGGCPCTPFTSSGQQHGPDDDRDLLPEAIRLAAEIEPRAILLENAAALVLSDKFAEYRETVVLGPLRGLGYNTSWTTIDVADYGVPQRRVRSVLVATRPEYTYRPPEPGPAAATVGEAIGDLMAARGWPGAAAWARGANTVAPTLVGGSEKHGGADLGPSGTKRAWAALGVNAYGVADEAPGPDGLEDRATFTPAQLRKLPPGVAAAMPMLTTEMGARLMGFPPEWIFAGGKTSRWAQCGNACPPPAARAVGLAIAKALGRAA